MPTASGLRNDRGSVIVIALVLILAMTILGLALFDLAQIEGQLASNSQADARALYVAQAGLERGIRELRLGFLADAYLSASWADATNGPTCTPLACDATQYRLMNIASTTVPATGTDPGGTYTLEMKLVTRGEANNPISQGAGYTYPYGQDCIVSPIDYNNAAALCHNLVFLRSTGTANGPPGFNATTMIQTLVKAAPTSPFAAALTAFGTIAAPAPAIDGRFRVAGTVQALGTGTSNPVIHFNGGAGDGMRNNYWILDQSAIGRYELDRILRRQLVCPPQTDCTGGANLVESLGAELRIYGNTTTTQMRFAASTDAGTNVNPGPYGQAGNQRRGKGRIDGAYVTDGCPLPCTSGAFVFGAGAQIWVDYNNYTKPYPDRPPRLPLWYVAGPSIPVLNNPSSINGTAYASYSTDFMQARGAPLANGQRVNGGVCPNNNAGTGWECSAGLPLATAPILWQLFNPNDYGYGGSFTGGTPDPNATPPFRHSFTFTDKTGAVRNAEICWRRTTMINDPANRDAGVSGPNLPSQAVPAQRPLTLEFGIPDCTAPNPPTDPILIYFPNRIAFSRHDATPRIYTYRGSAIIMQTNDSLQLEESLVSYCTRSTTAPGIECAAGERFAEDHLMVFLTFGLVDFGMVNPSVNTVMAYVWTDQYMSIQRDTDIIGSLRANHLCFQGASAAPCSTGGAGPDPYVFQATAWDLRRIPEELPGGGASGDRWRVDSVPRFWMVCRPGAVSSTPTANCGYQ
jgi:Tfp pilus assembly protein PilX